MGEPLTKEELQTYPFEVREIEEAEDHEIVRRGKDRLEDDQGDADGPKFPMRWLDWPEEAPHCVVADDQISPMARIMYITLLSVAQFARIYPRIYAMVCTKNVDMIRKHLWLDMDGWNHYLTELLGAELLFEAPEVKEDEIFFSDLQKVYENYDG